MRWLELNADGVVVNIVVWNGVEPYAPSGISQVLPCAENVGVSYGWTLIDDVWHAPIVEGEITDV